MKGGILYYAKRLCNCGKTSSVTSYVGPKHCGKSYSAKAWDVAGTSGGYCPPRASSSEEDERGKRAVQHRPWKDAVRALVLVLGTVTCCRPQLWRRRLGVTAKRFALIKTAGRSEAGTAWSAGAVTACYYVLAG